MLYYTEIGVSNLEIPSEKSLCVYISGCQNHCINCHYPELKLCDYGNILKDNIFSIISAYLPQITCVCFLGEGNNTFVEHIEFINHVKFVQRLNLKTAIYSGRNIFPEEWMKIFDYVKVGSYQKNLGDLFSRTTNQKLYLNQTGNFKDITKLFWNLSKNF